ncbi:MAG: hypothetical protein KAS63_04175 [Candidatus Heimdallarchaeota archaeon]|nr:hypothetical protein [Candidatus Heimdallarchaeota archaeon]MCK4954532.1 hypothetical protein [Candidatus Heimdallarchaeota archaeon]
MDELEVRAQIDRVLRQSSNLFTIGNGKRVRLNEAIRVREFTAVLGLIIAYSAGTFMSIDRFRIEGHHPIRYKRIINRLNCYSGQVSSALMLELLRLRDETKLSKYDLIKKVQEKYFTQKPIGTRDITESLNRMLRKTMDEFFQFEDRYFRRSDFELRLVEIPRNTPYELAKISLDNVIQF